MMAGLSPFLPSLPTASYFTRRAAPQCQSADIELLPN